MIWKPIPSAPGYEASEDGQIRHAATGELRTQYANSRHRYLQVNIKGSRRAHRLVAEAFHGPCPAGQECAHLNGNRQDNRAANLAWVTPRENQAHRGAHGTARVGEAHPAALASEEDVRRIRSFPRYARGVAEQFPHLSPGTVFAIRAGRNWPGVAGSR